MLKLSGCWPLRMPVIGLWFRWSRGMLRGGSGGETKGYADEEKEGRIVRDKADYLAEKGLRGVTVAF